MFFCFVLFCFFRFLGYNGVLHVKFASKVPKSAKIKILLLIEKGFL